MPQKVELLKRVIRKCMRLPSAISFLQNAQLQHPQKPDWLMEIGHIHLNKLGSNTAAHFYKRACPEFDTAPFYIARLHAQLLQRVGRDQEAYEFLTWLPRLCPMIPMLKWYCSRTDQNWNADSASQRKKHRSKDVVQ